jgi:tetratricopeptide (TPR) repeat protein
LIEGGQLLVREFKVARSLWFNCYVRNLSTIGITVILFIKPYPSLADIYDGRVALILGHYEKALEEFEQAAANGDPNALVEIGEMYEFGIGVEVNKIIAKDWYLKAAANGADKAYYRISGLELDKSFEWLKEGSLAEEPASQALLAQRYWLGHYPNGTKDFKKAIYWYQKAAKNGHCVAADSLSSFYEIGSFSPIGNPEKGSASYLDNIKAYMWQLIATECFGIYGKYRMWKRTLRLQHRLTDAQLRSTEDLASKMWKEITDRKAAILEKCNSVGNRFKSEKISAEQFRIYSAEIHSNPRVSIDFEGSTRIVGVYNCPYFYRITIDNLITPGTIFKIGTIRNDGMQTIRVNGYYVEGGNFIENWWKKFNFKKMKEDIVTWYGKGSIFYDMENQNP